MEIKKVVWKWFKNGLLALIPLGLIGLFASIIFSFLGGGLIKRFIKTDIPFLADILSFLVMLGFTLLLGIFISSKKGNSFILWLEQKILNKIPIIGGSFFTIKKIIHEKAPVVLIETPRMGMFSVGFITHTWLTSDKEETVAVFEPTNPVPGTGTTHILLKNETVNLNISTKEAFEYIFAAGGNLSEKFEEELSRGREILIVRRKLPNLKKFLEQREKKVVNSKSIGGFDE